MEIPDKAVGRRGSWFVRYWLPLMLYAGLIFFLSSQSHPEQFVPNLFFLKLGDKVLHAIEYAGLGFLSYRAFRHAAGTLGRNYAVLLGVGVATLYGATDEWHQAFVPFRESLPWIRLTPKKLSSPKLPRNSANSLKTNRIELCSRWDDRPFKLAILKIVVVMDEILSSPPFLLLTLWRRPLAGCRRGRLVRAFAF